MMTRRVFFTSVLFFCAITSGCSTESETKVVYQAYHPLQRQLPPDAVYSRVTWSHLPQPEPAPTKEKGQYLLPVMALELPNSNLEEAIESVSQTIGYSWLLPPGTGGRAVSLKMEGTVVEILDAIGKQANVNVMLNHEKRQVVVFEEAARPTLPGATLR